MTTQVQELLDKRFKAGKNFLISHPALLQELAQTFEEEIRETLRSQSFLNSNNRMAISDSPELGHILSRQILFAWGLGYAIGSTGVKEL